MGQQLHKYKNLLNREFQANRPNHKWVTDISYIHTGQGILYLSVIDNYIYFYNHQRIQLKTGVAPLEMQYFSYQGSFLCCPHNLGQARRLSGGFFLFRSFPMPGNDAKPLQKDGLFGKIT